MAVDTSIIVALAALAGSAVGACASVATTFVGQRLQARWSRMAAELDQQEELYRSFVKEAVPLFIDALQQTSVNTTKIMPLFSILGCIRLTSSDEVLRAAEDVGKRLLEAYAKPPEDPVKMIEQTFKNPESLDPFLDFTLTCRRERAKVLQRV
jgi:hypothetical protein